MSGGGSLVDRLLPWLGCVGAVVGWGASHQVGSNAIFDDCAATGGAFAALVCAAGLIVTLLGGVASFSVWCGGAGRGEAGRFIGLVSTLLAMLAAFAIILQLVSGLILPACAA